MGIKNQDRQNNDPFFGEIKLAEDKPTLTKREHVSSRLKTTKRTCLLSGAGGEEISEGVLRLQ